MSRGHPPPRRSGAQGVHAQVGAICWRRKQGRLQVLLITSRTRRRWIIPKGWPQSGRAPDHTAAKEAFEEAGVHGRVDKSCMGVFGYTKLGDGKDPDLPVVVSVFPLRVKSLAKSWPESSERRRRWFSPKRAAGKVQEPELRALLRQFDP